MSNSTLFHVRCERARTRGAIGVFYPILVAIDADTDEQAEQQYRAQYETQGPPVVVTVAAHACPNCGQWQHVSSGDCLNECRSRGFADVVNG